MRPTTDRETYLKPFVERLKAALNASGLTRAEIGRRIGVSKAAVAQWTSTGHISSENLIKFADVTGHDVGWLLSGKGGVTPEQRAWIDLLEQLPPAERRRIQGYAHVISLTTNGPSDQDSEEAAS